MKNYKYKAHFCKSDNENIAREDNFFKDQENAVLSKEHYLDKLEKYKEKAFKNWGLPPTEKRNEIIQKLRDAINNHNCKRKKWCKFCKEKRKDLNAKTSEWKVAHQAAQRRYAATTPGLIHGLCHIKDDIWNIQAKYKKQNGETKTEVYECDTAYVYRTWGFEYAAYAYQNSVKGDKGFVNVPEKEIAINGKVIQKVKYVKEIICKKIEETSTKQLVKNPYKKKRKIESTSGKRKRKNNNPGDQVGRSSKDKHYDLRPESDDEPDEIEVTTISRKRVPSGKVIPARWVVSYEDGTIGVEEKDDIQSMFGINFVNFCINNTSSKFLSVPVGANKPSHLVNWAFLIKDNAPRIEYNQKGKDDLCIPKSFASILHHVGFTKEAYNLDRTFNDKKFCFRKNDNNLKVIYRHAIKILPNWLQCTSKNINKIHWNDIKKYDLFLGVLEGSDGQVNHAISIFNNWIFDSNERIAIPLCKEGLNYCVSTPDSKVDFVKFYHGFFFRENSKHQRLKRFYEGEANLKLVEKEQIRQTKKKRL